jgi:hypothetical protein
VQVSNKAEKLLQRMNKNAVRVQSQFIEMEGSLVSYGQMKVLVQKEKLAVEVKSYANTLRSVDENGTSLVGKLGIDGELPIYYSCGYEMQENNSGG